MLNRKLLRDLFLHKGQVAGVLLIIILGIVVFSGLLMSHLDLSNSVEDFHRKTNYEDFSIEVSGAPVGTVESLGRLENVMAVEGRLSGEFVGSVDGSQVTMKVISVPPDRRPAVDDVVVESGSYLSADEPRSCLVELHLASEFDLRSGDSVALKTDKGTTSLLVSGIAYSPEFLRLVAGRSEFITDVRTFGIIYLGQGEAENLFGAEGSYNEFLFKVRDPSRLADTMEEAESALEPFNVIAAATGEEKPGNAMMRLDIDNLGQLSLFFSMLILMVALLALFVAITRLVVSQQRQMGVSRAIGYGKKTILLHYLGYGVVLGVAGGVLGGLGGYCLGRPFISVYSDALGLPPIVKFSFHWPVAAAGVVAAVLVSVLAAALPAWRAVKTRPAVAIRAEEGLSSAPARRLRKPGPAGPHRPRTWLLLSRRNLFRNLKRTVLITVGVVAALGVLLTVATTTDSLDSVFEKHVYSVQRWQVYAFFSGPQRGEVLEKAVAIEGTRQVEPAVGFPARLSTRGESADVDIQAFKRGTVMHGSFPTRGSKPEPGAGEILLGRGITNSLPVGIGDRVTLWTELGPLDLEVAGLLAEPYGRVGYINLEYLQSLAGGDYFNAIAATVAPGSQDEVARALGELPGVSRILTQEQVERVLSEVMGAVTGFMRMIYVIMFAVCFAIIFTLVTINALERRREVATMRTLGAGGRIVLGSLMVETMTIAVIAVVPAVALARFLSWVLLEKVMSSSVILAEVVFYAHTTVLFVTIFLAVAALSGLLPFRQLLRINLASATKERIG